MALYDDYFRNEDKPFAENLNDALLLSNVFDLTVPIEAPRMFSNSTWVDSTSTRKCGVSLLTLKEGLPTGVTVATDSQTGESVLTGTGTVELSIYPNFNSFGKYESFTWENTGSIVVNLKNSAGTTIASNISKGVIQSQSSELRTLQEIVVEFVFTDATLQSFGFVMANKDQERYGATVGIDDVTGLQDALDSIRKNDTVGDVVASISTIFRTVAVRGTVRNGWAYVYFLLALDGRLERGVMMTLNAPYHPLYTVRTFMLISDGVNEKIKPITLNTNGQLEYNSIERIDDTGYYFYGTLVFPILDYGEE